MLIRVGYNIRFSLNASAAMITMLNVHPSRENDLVVPERLNVLPEVQQTEFRDLFGNRGSRFCAPQGELHLRNSTLIRDSGEPDRQDFQAREVPVHELPNETLPYLMSSRYC